MNKFTRLLSVFLVIAVTSSLCVQSQELKKVDKFFKTEFYKNDEMISKKEFIAQLKTNKKATKHWNSSRTYNTLSWISLAAETSFAVWNLTDGKEKNKTATTGVYSSFAALLIFDIISNLQEKKAIKKYNDGIKNGKKITFKPSQKGLGVVMTF